MSKVSKSYYSAAIGHREAPGVFMASFAVPGEPAQWVTEGGRQKLFTTSDEAELAGFRVLAAKLNRALNSQEFKAKPSNQPQPRVHRQPTNRNEANQVFSKFR